MLDRFVCNKFMNSALYSSQDDLSEVQYLWGFPGGAVVNNPPANAEDRRDTGSIPGSGRSPGGGHGHPLQCSCLENPMGRGAWWAAVHRVAQSRTRLKQFNTHTHTHACINMPHFIYHSSGKQLQT